MPKYTVTGYDGYFNSLDKAKSKALSLSENTQNPIYVYNNDTKIAKYRVGFEMENFAEYIVEITDKELRTTAYLVNHLTHDIAIYDTYEDALDAGEDFIHDNTDRYKIVVKMWHKSEKHSNI